MKTKNKRKTSLKSSILLLLLFAILLITSSYAWFTSNRTVAVNALDVNVLAKNGLQISADGTNWKSIIQKTDLTGVHTTTYTSSINQISAELEPVSSAGTVTGGNLDLFYGTVGTNVDGDYTLTAVKEADAEGTTGKYIAFDLFFKVDANTDIYLSTDSGVLFTDAATKGLENAARVGFVVEGNTTAGSSISTIQGLNGGTAATTYIWEPNYDTHTAAGVSNAFDTYAITTTQANGTVLPYEGIIDEIEVADGVLLTEANSTTHSTLFDTVVPAYSTINGFSTNRQIFSLSAGITKVRIYMWVEGQDVDCENNASGAHIQFNLDITTVA